MAEPCREPGGKSAAVTAVVFDLFNTLTAPVDDSEFRSSLAEMAFSVGAEPGRLHGSLVRVLAGAIFGGGFATVEACVRGVCDAIGLRVAETAIS